MTYNLSIIGAGPRGLAALESIFYQQSQQSKASPLKVAIFEKGKHQGCSWIYYPEQPETNWLNILDRALELDARKGFTLDNTVIPSYPGYHEWNTGNSTLPNWEERDSFTSRGRLGSYLKERFQTIAEPLINAGHLDVFNSTVDSISLENDSFLLLTGDKKKYQCREVILCIGHQPTKISGQIEKWTVHAKAHDNIYVFPDPYPISNFTGLSQSLKNSTVAIRGFGLAMIDVARGLTQGLGGTFTCENALTRAYSYKPGKDGVQCLIPFSLDGLPLAPKPLNKRIDDQFKPPAAAINDYLGNIKSRLQEPQSISDTSFVTGGAIELATEIYLRQHGGLKKNQLSQEEIGNIMAQWLQDERYSHPLITSASQHPALSMQQFVDMAVGESICSIDYCLGQVWRHLQPGLYKVLAFPDFEPEVMADIISLDDRLKRYSYGPPVDAIQQLLALHRAGMMKLMVVDDPDIEMVESGWVFEDNGVELTASVMINSVLDSPVLDAVDTSLIAELREQEVISTFYQGLGARIARNLHCIDGNGNEVQGLAMFGRLTKGSILGADAILECFNPTIENWAQSFFNRESAAD